MLLQLTMAGKTTPTEEACKWIELISLSTSSAIKKRVQLLGTTTRKAELVEDASETSEVNSSSISTPNKKEYITLSSLEEIQKISSMSSHSIE